MTTREKVWDLLTPDEDASKLEHWLQTSIMALIFLNVLAVVFGSVQSLSARYDRWFDLFEVFSVAVFTIEYAARVWSCTVDKRYAHPVWGRIRFMFTPMALIDLIAVVPSYLTFLKLDLRFVRALRLVRLLRVAKIGRYTEASSLLLKVIRAKKEELTLTMSLLFILAVICASLMYYAEGNVQPDKFPNIPAAMWWAIVTITTIGYGDVFPITTVGKIIGVFTALLGILMIALPTGVFGAAFVEELNRREREKPRKCPHCGKEIH